MRRSLFATDIQNKECVLLVPSPSFKVPAVLMLGLQ